VVPGGENTGMASGDSSSPQSRRETRECLTDADRSLNDNVDRTWPLGSQVRIPAIGWFRATAQFCLL
jgi:hypothetical protein